MAREAGQSRCLPIFNVMANRVAAGLAMLRSVRFSPDLVIDVGAHTGAWTRMALPCFPAARFVMVEAQPDHEPALKAIASTRVSYAMRLFGRESRDRVAFLLAGTGSSLYSENTSFRQQRTTLPMATLDDVLQLDGGDKRIFLKLDVQGAELDVLEGARAELRRTEIILLEASLAEYNLGATRITEVIARLRELDFLLFDIWDLRRVGPILAQTDLVFVRRGSNLETQAAAIRT
jgi:FkbM family methyltransferase